MSRNPEAAHSAPRFRGAIVPVPEIEHKTEGNDVGSSQSSCCSVRIAFSGAIHRVSTTCVWRSDGLLRLPVQPGISRPGCEMRRLCAFGPSGTALLYSYKFLHDFVAEHHRWFESVGDRCHLLDHWTDNFVHSAGSA